MQAELNSLSIHVHKMNIDARLNDSYNSHLPVKVANESSTLMSNLYQLKNNTGLYKGSFRPIKPVSDISSISFKESVMDLVSNESIEKPADFHDLSSIREKFNNTHSDLKGFNDLKYLECKEHEVIYEI